MALVGVALDRAFISTAESNLQVRLGSYALAYAADIEFDIDGYLVPPFRAPDPRLDRPGSGLYATILVPNGSWASQSSKGPDLPEGRRLRPDSERFDLSLIHI